MKVQIPMSMLVINVKAKGIAVTGDDPIVDNIENATPRDIKNKPPTNKQILLITDITSFLNPLNLQ